MSRFLIHSQVECIQSLERKTKRLNLVPGCRSAPHFQVDPVENLLKTRPHKSGTSRGVPVPPGSFCQCLSTRPRRPAWRLHFLMPPKPLPAWNHQTTKLRLPCHAANSSCSLVGAFGGWVGHGAMALAGRGRAVEMWLFGRP